MTRPRTSVWTLTRIVGFARSHDKINLEVTRQVDWSLRCGFDSRSPNRASWTVPGPVAQMGDTVAFTIPTRQATRPGIDAELELRRS